MEVDLVGERKEESDEMRNVKWKKRREWGIYCGLRGRSIDIEVGHNQKG